MLLLTKNSYVSLDSKPGLFLNSANKKTSSFPSDWMPNIIATRYQKLDIPTYLMVKKHQKDKIVLLWALQGYCRIFQLYSNSPHMMRNTLSIHQFRGCILIT